MNKYYCAKHGKLIERDIGLYIMPTKNYNFCFICFEEYVIKNAIEPMDETEFRPCPFCKKSTATLISDTRPGKINFRVQCMFCYAQTGVCLSAIEAIEIWRGGEW